MLYQTKPTQVASVNVVLVIWQQVHVYQWMNYSLWKIENSFNYGIILKLTCSHIHVTLDWPKSVFAVHMTSCTAACYDRIAAPWVGGVYENFNMSQFSCLPIMSCINDLNHEFSLLCAIKLHVPAWPVAQMQLSSWKAVCCGQFGLHLTLECSQRVSRWANHAITTQQCIDSKIYGIVIEDIVALHLHCSF